MLADSGSAAKIDEAAAYVLAGFDEVAAHSDVVPGLTAIHNSGIQVTDELHLFKHKHSVGFQQMTVVLKEVTPFMANLQVGTLTNGSKAVTQKFLDRSNLAFVGPVLDVEGPRAWKPSKDIYLYAVKELGLQPSEVRGCLRIAGCQFLPHLLSFLRSGYVGCGASMGLRRGQVMWPAGSFHCPTQ